MWRDGEDLYAELSLPEREHPQAEEYGVHPALFDAAVQVIIVGITSSGAELQGKEGDLRLPFSFNGLHVYVEGASALRVHLVPAGDGAMSMVAADADGTLVACMEALAVRPVSREQIARAARGARDSLFALEWRAAAPAPAERAMGGWALLGAGEAGLCETLESAGAQPDCYDDLQELAAAVGDGRAAPDVVLVDYARPPLEAGTEQLGAGADGSEPSPAPSSRSLRGTKPEVPRSKACCMIGSVAIAR